MEKMRFGIVAAGTIAHKFAKTAPLAPEMALAAVASRTQEKADEFAAAYGIPKAYGSYEALYADPEIDAVYIATPHPFHKACCLDAIAHGKHVLCEKPLTLTREDSAQVYAAAREKGVFLMEAMWTRFIPTVQTARSWIMDGRIGEVRLITANFGYDAKDPKVERNIYNKAMNGGALYDVGVYCIEAALDFLPGQKVTEISGMARLASTGVDGVNALLLRFSGGALAVLSSAIQCSTQNEANIYGSEGYIRLSPNFYFPRYAELYENGKLSERHEAVLESGFEFEIRHFIECVRAGLPESPRIPPADTLACAEIFDYCMKNGFVGQ